MSKIQKKLQNVSKKGRNRHCSYHFEGCSLTHLLLYYYRNLHESGTSKTLLCL